MCMNCGCGQVNERHKPTDITIDDLTAAAKGHEMEVEDLLLDGRVHARGEIGAGRRFEFGDRHGQAKWQATV